MNVIYVLSIGLTNEDLTESEIKTIFLVIFVESDMSK